MNCGHRKTGSKSLARIIAMALALNIPTQGMAAAQWCSGLILKVWVESTGNLMIRPDWRLDHIRVCNLKEPVTGNGVSIEPAVCMTWLSLLKSAKLDAKPTTIMYSDIPTTCALVPTYSAAPFPSYIMLD